MITITKLSAECLNDFILRQLKYQSVSFSNYSKDYKNISFFLDQIKKSPMFLAFILIKVGHNLLHLRCWLSHSINRHLGHSSEVNRLHLFYCAEHVRSQVLISNLHTHSHSQHVIYGAFKDR